MFRLPDRLPLAISTAGVALLIWACTDQTTGPTSNDLRVHNDVIQPAGYIIDTGPGGTDSGGSQALFSSGSTTCSPQPACAGYFQFLGGKFTLTNQANVQSVEGWMLGTAGSIDVYIRTDSTPPTGANIPGHSLHAVRYSVAAQGVFGWKAFTNFTVTLAPGTYWLTFEPVPSSGFSGSMAGGVADSLADYAYFADGNNRWVTFSFWNQNPGLGFRVYGQSVITTQQLITNLRTYVDGAGLATPITKKLDGYLQNALNAVNANNTATACTNMQALIDYVNKQSVRKIPANVSTEIISEANAIRSDLGC